MFVCVHTVLACLFFSVSYVYISSFGPTEDEAVGWQAVPTDVVLKICIKEDFSLFFI